MIVIRPNNMPFKNVVGAKMYAGKMFVNYKIVPHLEGFGIETDGVKKEKINKVKRVISENQPIETATGSASDKPAKLHRVTSPWKPAPLIDFPDKYKDPNYVYRFVKKDRAGNVQKKISENWEIDTQVSGRIMKENPEILAPTINDGGQLDKTLNIRELVLMRMPKEVAVSRMEYYENKNKAAQLSAESTYKQENKSTYGKVKIAQEN
jgi:hypothetical protein